MTKHFDAYRDVDWDAHRIDPDDPRFELPKEGLGATAWYQAQPEATRANIGLHMVVHQMRAGVVFENVLSQGLLRFAVAQPQGALSGLSFRYAMHEVIEESQHSLMFQEFVHRSGLIAPGLPAPEAFAARFVPGLAERFPELFFIYVLGGEGPIDHVQRRALARGGLHPLLERIMRIHVLEEARHLYFARTYLEVQVPQLSPLKMGLLQLKTPLVLASMAKLMMRLPRALVQAYRVPRAAVQQAYASAEHRVQVQLGLASIRTLCERLGVLTDRTRPLWRALGLIEARPVLAAQISRAESGDP